MQNVYTLTWKSAPYKQAWDFQEKILAHNLEIKRLNKVNNTQISTLNVFLFCEHNPVFTLGKSGDMANLLLSEEQLAVQHIDFFPINRGGDITYHGPGQITGYPILDLECFKPSAAWYVNTMEEMIIRTLADLGIVSSRFDGYPGVWVDAFKPAARKICAIGIKLSRFISIHGFALNVNTELGYFNKINPCGLDIKAVSSIAKELHGETDFDMVIEKIKNQFTALFEAELQPITFDGIEQIIGNTHGVNTNSENTVS